MFTILGIAGGTLLKQLLVSLVVTAIGYMLMPKPKGPKPDEVKDLETPTAESGIPIPVVFGDITVKGVNFLWYGEKTTVFKKL